MILPKPKFHAGDHVYSKFNKNWTETILEVKANFLNAGSDDFFCWSYKLSAPPETSKLTCRSEFTTENNISLTPIK